MYQLAISREFIAQHYLIGGDWGEENKKHSHHYKIEVLMQSENLNEHGYLIDIVELENSLLDVINVVRDKTLNDLPAFTGLNPSLEHFSRIIWEMLQQKMTMDGSKLTIKLWENENDWAAYCPS